MSKINSVFIDFRNPKHVKWWNDVASKLIRVVRYDTIVETATDKPVGCIFLIKGPLKNWVIKKNTTFLGDKVVTAKFKTRV